MNKVSFDTRIDPLRDFRRALTVKVMASVLDRDVGQVAAKYYGKDADVVAKAAVVPTDTTNATGLAGVRVGPFLRSLRGRSAAASLFGLGLDVDLAGVGSATLPAIGSDMPNAAWVAEGAPIPVFRASLDTTPLILAPRKLAAMAALTNELADLSADAAEQVISDLLAASVSRALDTKLFSTDADNGVAPAGILNGINAIAGTAGNDQEAMVADLRALVASVTASGGGGNLVIIAAPPQAITLQLMGGNLSVPVIIGPHLANSTVIVMDAGAFASGFSGAPRIEVSENALVHLEDTNPQQIGTTGTPNVVAAPARSAFQTDMKVLRTVLRASFGLRAPAIAFTTTATW